MGNLDPYRSRTDDAPALFRRWDPVVYGARQDSDALCPSEVQAYRQDGFLVIDRVLQTPELKGLNAERRRLASSARTAGTRASVIRDPDSGETSEITSVHRLSPLFRRLSRDERFVKLADFLLDDRVYLYQSRLSLKPGVRCNPASFVSTFEAWHIENAMPRMRALCICLVLTEPQLSKEQFIAIRGSHRAFIAREPMPSSGREHDGERAPRAAPPDPLFVNMLRDRGGVIHSGSRPGSIILFDCNLLQISNPDLLLVYNSLQNAVPEPRRRQNLRPEALAGRREVSPIECLSADQLLAQGLPKAS